MSFDNSYSPLEPFEMEERPNCINCCDTGTFYNEQDLHDYCDCEQGRATFFLSTPIEDGNDAFSRVEDVFTDSDYYGEE